jgi:hypothetical protein
MKKEKLENQMEELTLKTNEKEINLLKQKDSFHQIALQLLTKELSLFNEKYNSIE